MLNCDEPLSTRLASAVSLSSDSEDELYLLIYVTGTNAHCIIDDAGSYLRSRQLHGHALKANLPQHPRITNGSSNATNPTTVPRLFVLSANDEHSLRSLASSYAAYLGSLSPTDETLYIEQLAYTLQSRRSLLPWREAVVASDLKELSEKLSSEEITPCRNSGLDAPRLGFVFTGQGAQWPGMGFELMETYQVYKDTIVAADKHLQSLGAKWSLVGKFPDIRNGLIATTILTCEQMSSRSMATKAVFPQQQSVNRLVQQSKSLLCVSLRPGVSCQSLWSDIRAAKLQPPSPQA